MLGLNKLSLVAILGVATLAQAQSPLSYNVYAKNTVKLDTSRIEGQLAAGGTVTLTDYAVGTSLAADSLRCDLTSGANLYFTRGSVSNGRICVAGQIYDKELGSTYDPLPYAKEDLVGTSQYANTLSSYYSRLKADYTAVVKGDVVELIGTKNGMNVVTISAEVLAKAGTVKITAPTYSTVVVNVSGTDVQIVTAGTKLVGVTADHVLWNLPVASRITMNSSLVEGSVLAPYAKLVFNKGRINGSVVVSDVEGNGFFSHQPFVGTF